jgi:hypothetical protein
MELFAELATPSHCVLEGTRNPEGQGSDPPIGFGAGPSSHEASGARVRSHVAGAVLLGVFSSVGPSAALLNLPHW